MEPARRPFDEMNRFFERTGDALFGQVWSPERPFELFSERRDFSSPGNYRVETTDDGYVVMADVPGFERDELTIEFDHGILKIHGETSTREDSEESWHSQQRRVQKQISLPKKVITEEITAEYKNGVLEITLPTVETPTDESPHRIDIN